MKEIRIIQGVKVSTRVTASLRNEGGSFRMCCFADGSVTRRYLLADYTSPRLLRDEDFVSLRTVTARHTLTLDEQGVARCWWAGSDQLYVSYHDDEWGFPVTDDVRLFEKLSLEGFQAGLSWPTILRKREGFRAAFGGFDFREVADFGERDMVRLLDDAGIIRHRGKIEATINNANRAIELVEEFGSLASYAWGFAPDRPEPPTELPAMTPESTAMSKDLKRRGWKFVGPTTIYAFMQAMGLVNDHLAGCVVRPEAEAARRAMDR
jgi:DNA-3-methyladenine glycosylase I